MLAIGLPGPLELLLLAGLFAGALIVASIVGVIAWVITRRGGGGPKGMS